MNLDLNSLSDEDRQELLKSLFAGQNADFVSTFVKENEEANAIVAAATAKKRGRKRIPSFLKPFAEAIVLAMGAAFGEDDEVDTSDAASVCAALNDKIASLQKTSDYFDYDYVVDGIEHTLKVSVVSYTQQAENAMRKALKDIAEAEAGDFEKLVEKHKNKLGDLTIDDTVIQDYSNQFTEAVENRRVELENGVDDVVDPDELEPPVSDVPPPPSA